MVPRFHLHCILLLKLNARTAFTTYSYCINISFNVYILDDNIEMMQDSNTVNLLVEAVKTHIKVFQMLSP